MEVESGKMRSCAAIEERENGECGGRGFGFGVGMRIQSTIRFPPSVFPWDSAPKYILRDNDGIYGQVFLEQLDALGIEDVPTAPRSPWQNPYVERLIGTVRRDCLDHVIVF